MKLYTFYTDSHSVLLNDWFLPSFHQNNKNIELIVTKFDQKCKSGVYLSEGWLSTMHDKLDLIITGIQDNWNDYFIHADCDIQFFGDIKQNLLDQVEGYDLAGINEDPLNEGSEICCGFFICKGNEKTLSLFKEVKKIINGNFHDQHAFNYIRNNYISSKKLNYKYYNVCHSNGPKLWTPGMLLDSFKPDILVHHANWIEGVTNKIENLKLVKSLVNGN